VNLKFHDIKKDIIIKDNNKRYKIKEKRKGKIVKIK